MKFLFFFFFFFNLTLGLTNDRGFTSEQKIVYLCHLPLQIILDPPWFKPAIFGSLQWTLQVLVDRSHLPVWVLVCRLRSNVSLNPLPQNVHRYRLTSLWHFMWRLSNRWRLKLFEQRWQANRVLSLPPVVDSTFSGVGAGGGRGGMMAPTSWLASGFFTPWPPLTNSKVTPLGRPSCGGEVKILESQLKNYLYTSENLCWSP